MRISETKLREMVTSTVVEQLVEELVVEEFFKLLIEQDDELSDEEYIELWKKKPSFREKVRDAFNNFDAMSSLKKKMAIVALGMLGAAGTQFTADYAAQAQAKEIASQLRAQSAETKAEYFGTVEDLKNFRQAAGAEGPAPIDVDDTEGIQAAKDKFMAMGVQKAPIIPDRVIAMQTGETQFGYTPADNISDNEILPFVGMSKADWESLVRTWLTDADGRERLEKYVGTSGKTQAMFWAYGPQGQVFFDAYDDKPDGSQGLWLPPEWSVAYDVIQKNKARAGNLKENFRKYLHYILEVL